MAQIGVDHPAIAAVSEPADAAELHRSPRAPLRDRQAQRAVALHAHVLGRVTPGVPPGVLPLGETYLPGIAGPGELALIRFSARRLCPCETDDREDPAEEESLAHGPSILPGRSRRGGRARTAARRRGTLPRGLATAARIRR